MVPCSQEVLSIHRLLLLWVFWSQVKCYLSWLPSPGRCLLWTSQPPLYPPRMLSVSPTYCGAVHSEVRLIILSSFHLSVLLFFLCFVLENRVLFLFIVCYLAMVKWQEELSPKLGGCVWDPLTWKTGYNRIWRFLGEPWRGTRRDSWSLWNWAAGTRQKPKSWGYWGWGLGRWWGQRKRFQPQFRASAGEL